MQVVLVGELRLSEAAAKGAVALPSCECEGACDADDCPCAEKASLLWQGFLHRGRPPVLTPVVIARDNASVSEHRGWDATVYECNTSCRCTHECPNRVVQFKDSVAVSSLLSGCLDLIDRGPVIGLGLRTAVPIVCGQFICEYVGDVLSEVEGASRIAQVEASGERNYVLCCSEVRVVVLVVNVCGVASDLLHRHTAMAVCM